MSMPPATASLAQSVIPRVFPAIGLAAGLAGLADWLFYGHSAGISVPIFVLAVAASSAALNGAPAPRRVLVAAGAMLFAALLPSIEAAGPLSLLFALVGMALFALITAGRFSWIVKHAAADVAWMLLSGPLRFAADAAGLISRGLPRTARTPWLAAWIMPVCLGLVFLGLFNAANPLLADWLAAIDLSDLIRRVSLPRALFWLLVAAFAWPFLCLRLPPRDEGLRPAKAVTAAPAGALVDLLFGRAAILRSLVLFNALFAVQSGMDAAYLWGGVALPSGMSYASYAHRGAYPLIVTALLAGAFVLAAMRPGSATEESPLIRALVFAWVGQNVVLVLSSILRLDLYVDVYALTRLRVAAFIWMGLVAVGLLLIVARVVLRGSNRWLIAANATALAATLYVSSFVNVPRLIGDFNVAHSFEVSGRGTPLDIGYLCSLGPQAIPAIDAYRQHAAERAQAIPGALSACRSQLRMAVAARASDWRAWSFRAHRLALWLPVGADAAGLQARH